MNQAQSTPVLPFDLDAPRLRLDRADAVEWLLSLPAESVNLLVIDPAYESLEKHRAVGTTTRLKHSASSSNDWFEIFRNERFPALFAAAYRALAKNAHFYFLCDMETMWVARPLAEVAGFKFWKDIIWNKMAIGMGYHYRAQVERVLFFEKGKRKLSNLGTPDFLDEAEQVCDEVLWAKRLRGGELYPTEKPVELLSVLVQQSSAPGDVVADCFAGSGSTGAAALSLGHRFWGCDVSDRALLRCTERLTPMLGKAGAP